MQQNIIEIKNEDYSGLDQYIIASRNKKIFLVCGDSIRYHAALNKYFETLKDRIDIDVIRFSNFQPNPQYKSVVEGVRLFIDSGAKQIVAVGGGSAIDVAKCIKLYSNMNPSKNYLEQVIIPNDVRLLAIPTTAGTGSEATRYAVIYYEGVKQSVSDYKCIPTDVVFDPSLLKTLPLSQKKSTLLDALSHALESMWSVNSTEESKNYSREAIKMILKNKDAYISGDFSVSLQMFMAAFLAGKAINVTETTGGHAMCYKLTSLYGLPHGEAAALVNSKLFPWMVENTNKCIDPRGEQYLCQTFDEIAAAFGVDNAQQAADAFNEIVRSFKFQKIDNVRDEDFQILKKSVNPVRLKNNPVALDEDTIDMLYHEILS